MNKEIVRILLKHYTKIGLNGGIAKVIFDDEFEDIAEEIVKLCNMHFVSNTEVAVCKCPYCSRKMKGVTLTHYRCKKCKVDFTN